MYSSSNIKVIILSAEQITEMNWEGSPLGLQRILLIDNQISQLNWRECPESLQDIDLAYNQITKMLWKGCPKGMQRIDLGYNKISQLNWDCCPEGLHYIDLRGNEITEINWEGCPEGLKGIYPNRLNCLFQDYKKTKAFFIAKTKPKRDINAEICANSMLPPNNKVTVFNVLGYKQNFYEMVREMQSILQ
jgi:Leucine-rich repeat (LRR) protein